jgi:Ran GTPase-activating protein (RanGAP) involved in mRNA processing and transport
MPSLKRLLLCQNRLDDRCVWSLIELLANTATNLQHIDISGNDFSAVGLASLTEAALSCYNLRSFILCDEMTNVQSTIESRASKITLSNSSFFLSF